MVMPKKKPAVKSCEKCGRRMVQPRWKNAKLDSTFRKRRFCSRKCYGRWVEDNNPTVKPNSARKRARKLKRGTTRCEDCGKRRKLHRHHLDGNPQNNHLDNVRLLCQSCHTADHMAEETWGSGRTLQPKRCKICDREFQPIKARDKLCKKKACLRENGRLSARKRWQTE